MKKNLLFIFIGLVISQIAFSQTFNTQWQKCYGGTQNDAFKSYISTLDGGFVAAGSSLSNDGDLALSNHGEADAWIVKFNSLGNIEWQNNMGGSSNETFTSIVQTTDGGYIATGYTTSYDGEIVGNHGGYDIWVVKFNNTGTVLWKKCLGGSGEEAALSAHQTIYGGCIIVGYSTSTDHDVSGNHGGVDVWIIKLSSLGVIEWQNSYGGSSSDVGLSIITTPEGGYIFTGYTLSNDGDISVNRGYEDAWVVKLNNVGTIEWQKTYGGSSFDEGLKIINTNDGGYAIAGYSLSNDGNVSGNHGGADGWFIKLSTIGNVEWQKSFGGSNTDIFASCTQTADGEFIIAGYSESNDGDVSNNYGNRDIWLLKITDVGRILWQKNFGGSATDRPTEFCGVVQLPYGEYLLAGYTSSNNNDVSGNHGGADAWLLKFKVTNFNLFPDYPCQDKYERLTSEGCNGTTRWYMNLAGQMPTLISSSPNFDYLVPANLPVQTPIFFECWCLNVLNGQTLIGSGYARVLGVTNYNLSSPIDDINTTPPLPYNVSHTINATNKILGANTNVEYRAEESIMLLPGFQANSNTVFKAHIGGCNQ